MDVDLSDLRKMDEAQVILHLFLTLGFADVFHLHAELDVPADRQPGKQAEFLEDQNAISSGPIHRRAINQNLPRCLRMQPGYHMQQRTLSTSPRPTHAKKHSPLHSNTHLV